MCDIFFLMFSHEMHLFIHFLYALHVGASIIGKFDFSSPTYMLGSPIKVSHVYWATDFASYGVETSLPTFDGFTCAFGSNGQVACLGFLHLMDGAKY